jgi:hypothetical protein
LHLFVLLLGSMWVLWVLFLRLFSFSLPCFIVFSSATGSGQLGVSAATSATAGTPQGIAVPSLTPATQYDCYCATVSGSVLGTKLDLYSSGFTSHPAKNGDVAGNAITGRWCCCCCCCCYCCCCCCCCCDCVG